MLIRFECPDCHKPLNAPVEKVGARTTCPGCRTPITVPDIRPDGQNSPSLAAQATPEICQETPKSAMLEVQAEQSPGSAGSNADTSQGQAIPTLISTQFLTCLQLVFDGDDLDIGNEPDELVPALAKVFEARRKIVRERRQYFWTNLKHVCDVEEVEHPDEYVEQMASRLKAWRSHNQQQMQKFLLTVPEDDPLRCPISLFGTLGLRRIETAHTSTLAWLLDPKQPHGFEFAPMEALLTYLVKIGTPSRRLSVDTVKKEYPMPVSGEPGRIDVYATGDWSDEISSRVRWLLAIEAKIDASEGDGQLEHYDQWIIRNKDGRQPIRVFLTKEGRKPDVEPQVFPEPWIPLSFQDVVGIFRELSPRLRGKPGFEFLRFYLTGILKDIYRWEIPVPSAESCANPYAYVDFLKTAHK